MRESVSDRTNRESERDVRKKKKKNERRKKKKTFVPRRGTDSFQEVPTYRIFFTISFLTQ